ncbi:MAG: UDP-glucose/GDP-mannose dehydrogenase family protein [Nitrososphaerota archaeon]
MIYRIGVIGLGYVGLPLACAFASRSFKVIGLDTDLEKIESIKNAETPIYEEGLQELLKKVLEDKTFKVASSYKEVVEEAEVYFICVGTPSNPDGSVDLKYVKEAVEMLSESLKRVEKYSLLVVRSTIPPGTTSNIIRSIVEERSGKKLGEYGLCFNPEFLREGNALHDIFNPDRIIIGAIDEKSGAFLLDVYKKFHGDSMPPILLTNPTNAELIKYANNVFLATKISFINMVSQLCQNLPDADVKIVAEGIGMDKRIGREFLNAGLGWGGSCFPKDVKAFLRFGEEMGLDFGLVKSIIKINESQIKNAIKLAEELVGRFKGKTISILGLAFKPGTDDVRESRSIRLIDELLKYNVKIKVHDPKALEKAKKILGDRVIYCRTIEECLSNSDLCIVATEWSEYKEIKQEMLKKYMRNPALLDCRRLYDPEQFKDVRFAAIGLGYKKAGH